ncbi:hypothetical protein EDC94DRAFT_604808 [Helicostylum pulchrum]|nr:hypothetical protein EDC94DRAFT_604808 [Helicostylum pulchrum]
MLLPGIRYLTRKAGPHSGIFSQNGLYVGAEESTATAPNRRSHIKDFREVINLLYKFKVSIKDLYN